jgi:hypothetical protein
VEVGKGIGALLAASLQGDDQVVVLEQPCVIAGMKEQGFNKTNRVKQGSFARVGRVTGADLLLLGDIVVFGLDD